MHALNCSQEHGAEYTWENGVGSSFRMSWSLPGFAKHPLYGHPVFFYGYGTHGSYFDELLPDLAYDDRPFHNRLGGGREIRPDELAAMSKAFDEVATRFEWQAGDILCLDNFRFGHGRDPYTGPRDVLAANGPAVNWAAAA